MTTFTGTAGADSFIGGAADDLFRFTPATLQAGDVAQGGAGFDTLQFTAAGSIGSAVLAGITGMERVQIATASSVSIVLTAAFVLSAGGLLEVRGNAGDDLVNGAALTDPALRLSFVAVNGGADTLIGGAGDDSVTLQSVGARRLDLGGGNDAITAGFDHITAADTILGGAGTDRIGFNTAGTVLAAALVGLSSIEEIALPNLPGMSLQVSDAMATQAGGVLKVVGTSATQAVDAGAVGPLHGVLFTGGTGGDSFIGGAGADTFEAADAASGNLGGGADLLRLTSTLAGAASIAGGAGVDSIVLTRGGDWLLGPALTGFEEVEITANGTRLTVGATAGLEVIGSGFNDRVILGAAGQSFFGFEGNDTVVVTAAMLAGIVLHGGDHTTRDTLVLSGDGLFDLRRSFITGFERIEVTPDVSSTVRLGAQALDLILRGSASAYLGANPAQSLIGSGLGDVIVLGAAGQVVAARGGSDTIQATAAQLGIGTLIDGGGGADQLVVLGGGTADLVAGALLQNVETISLQASTDLTLDAVPALQVLGSTGADTIRAALGDLTGDLGNGNDVLIIATDDLPAAAGTFTFGSGFDTLRVAQGGFVSNLLIPTRFQQYERLDLQALNNVGSVTIQDTADREILLPAAPIGTVIGGGGNETFFMASAAASDAQGGGGNDTMNGSAFSDYLQGGSGNDSLWGDAGYDWLLGGSGNDSLSGGNDGDQMDGGTGADTMRGGPGDDWFYIDGTSSLTDWGVHARTVIGAEPGLGVPDLDKLIIINAAGGSTLNLAAHQISEIDRIELGTGSLTLILSDAMAATANDGSAGTLSIGRYAFDIGGHVINGSALAASRRLFVDELDGGDSIVGGAGPDTLRGAAGNDTIKGGDGTDSLDGGSGNDELRGENGTDLIDGGAGADSIWGDAGADTLSGGAGDNASDRFAYNGNTNGSPDIDGNGGPTFGADVIQNFQPRTSAADTAGDWIALSVAGLGLGITATKMLAENETWSGSAIYVVHPNDYLNGANMANLGEIAAAVNTRAGAKSGWSVNKVVAFALSNNLAGADARTGIYWWKDLNGDGVLSDVNDDVRLLASITGVTTASFSADTVVIA